MSDPTNPPHYRWHPKGIEAIDVCEHFGFRLGNVIKYIWRADLTSDPIRTLEKALWYLNREVLARKVESKQVRECFPDAPCYQHECQTCAKNAMKLYMVGEPPRDRD